MFSPEHYIPVDWSVSPTDSARAQLTRICAQFGLQGALLVSVNPQTQSVQAIASCVIPIEPFNGSENRYLVDALKDCFSKCASPHIHSIGDWALSGILRRVASDIRAAKRMWFYPLQCERMLFIFIGFPEPDCREKRIPKELDPMVRETVSDVAMGVQYDRMKLRLDATELFAREVGHDISSSIQAVLGKIQMISQNRVRGLAAIDKAKEIQDEILAMHRHAESLGIAVDRDYQIKDRDSYDLVDAMDRAIAQYRSEAEIERHLTFKLVRERDSLPLFGDKRAIEHAIGQLLSNAIKYSHGGGYILVELSGNDEFARCVIKNKGVPLPEGSELKSIWEFGVRSAIAKELHVNGSGIGLYTVRKIIQAHRGTVSAESFGKNRENTAFRISLPTKKYLQRHFASDLITIAGI